MNKDAHVKEGRERSRTEEESSSSLDNLTWIVLAATENRLWKDKGQSRLER